MFPLLTTAAGTIPPARVLVVGAGVAGLSAIATARRLGALVEAYDVRPAVKEEVESLGARFVELPFDTGQEGGGSGAYARQLTEEQLRQQQELLAKTVAGSDVVITTAQVQGAKAPVIVTSAMVEQMSPGRSSSTSPPNRAATARRPSPVRSSTATASRSSGRSTSRRPSPRTPASSTPRTSRTCWPLMIHDGVIDVDVDDDVIRDTLVARDGEIVHTRVREVYGLPVVAPPRRPPPPAAGTRH